MAGVLATYLVGSACAVPTSPSYKVKRVTNSTTSTNSTASSKASIMLPLYIYPSKGAWDPLTAAISLFPTVSFTVIVNPQSGPGAAPWWPNTDYVREVPLLNKNSNVKTIGYVRTGYCTRPMADIKAEIDAYAAWSRDTRYPGLGVNGIFFDETPNSFSNATKAYLDAITAYAKQASGILGDKLVIHNPGTAVDSRLSTPGPDTTVTVEEPWSKYQTPDYQNWLATSPYDHGRSTYMVYSTPLSDVAAVTWALRKRANYLFVTDGSDAAPYEGFGKSWGIFVAAMAGDTAPCYM